MTFDTGAIVLPTGAWARTQRRYLRRDGITILALTAGDFRPYVFPLFTPAGFAVTSEAPADHPHHQSVWIGADHVHALVPAGEGVTEEYTYNCYINDVFQGRAPGRIVETAATFLAAGNDASTIYQSLEWRGPSEWAAPQGRVILAEERTMRVRMHPDATVLHLRSRLAPVTWPVTMLPLGITVTSSITIGESSVPRTASSVRLVSEAWDDSSVTLSTVLSGMVTVRTRAAAAGSSGSALARLTSLMLFRET